MLCDFEQGRVQMARTEFFDMNLLWVLGETLDKGEGTGEILVTGNASLCIHTLHILPLRYKWSGRLASGAGCLLEALGDSIQKVLEMGAGGILEKES